MKITAQIFLSYARPDKKRVEELYQKLSDVGLKPWMDTQDLIPGEKWKPSIEKAIRDSHFFLACLSPNSITRRGVLQWELKVAMESLQGMLENDIYLIPVRLEDCQIPESLSEIQWVDLFEESGWPLLIRAIEVGVKRREEVMKTLAEDPTTSKSESISQQHPEVVAIPASVEAAKLLKELGQADERVIEALRSWLTADDPGLRFRAAKLLVEIAEDDEVVVRQMATTIHPQPWAVLAACQRIAGGQELSRNDCEALAEITRVSDGDTAEQRAARRILFEWAQRKLEGEKREEG